jgi:hypothetical protein
MKAVVLLLCLVLALGVVALLFTGKPAAAPGADVHPHASASGPGSEEAQLSAEPAAAEAGRTAAASATRASPGSALAAQGAPSLAHAAPAQESVAPAPSEFGITDAASTAASIDAVPVVDHDGFAAKYKDQSLDSLKSSLEAVEAILQLQSENRDKTLALDAAELQALERERVWLKQHAFP